MALTYHQKYSIASSLACAGLDTVTERMKQNNVSDEAIDFAKSLEKHFKGKRNGFVPKQVVNICRRS